MVDSEATLNRRPFSPPFHSSVEVNKPSLADHLQASIASTRSIPSLLHTKETSVGKCTFSLTTRGKELGKTIYEEICPNTNTALFQAEAYAMRMGINQNLKGIREEKRAALSLEWKNAGRKKRGNMDVFNREFEQRLANDAQVQRSQLARRLLSSITQQARAASTKAIREIIRASITDSERQMVAQALSARGKKLPKSRALQDTIITDYLMKHREKPPSQETERAELLVAQARLRVEKNQQRQKGLIEKAVRGLGSRLRHLSEGIESYFSRLTQPNTLLAATGILAFFSSLSPTTSNLSRGDIARAFAAPVAAVAEMAHTSSPSSAISLAITVDQTPQAPVQEVKVLPAATYGEITTEKPVFYRPGSNEEAQFAPTDKKIEVLHPTGTGRFLVRTPRGVFEISIDQLEIQGQPSWEKDIKPLDWLGFDNTDPNLVDDLVGIGAGNIRIPLNQATEKFYKENPWIKSTVEKAKAKKLDILLSYIPTGPLSEEEARKRISAMLSMVEGYDKVSIEIGNEPDIPTFWHGSDFDAFAKFVKQTAKIIREQNPKMRLVIGAASEKEAIVPMLRALKRNGVNLKDFTLGAHAYNTAAEVNEKMDILDEEAPGIPIIFTEIGSNKSAADKGQNTAVMVSQARIRGAVKAIIFQLPDVKFAGGNGNWGYVDRSGKRLKPFWHLAGWIWGKSKSVSSASSRLTRQ